MKKLLFVLLLCGVTFGANVYYSVGSETGDMKTGSPTVTISSGTATFSAAQTTDSMGVGDRVFYDAGSVAYISGRTSETVWSLVTALGANPSNEAVPVTVDSIMREYSSLTSAEAGASDANHLNTVDLVTGTYTLHLACYADGADQNTVVINGWTTDATYYIKIYTPVSTSEVGTSQRHEGKWGSGYQLAPSGDATHVIDIDATYTHIQGLQVQNVPNNTQYRYVLNTSADHIRIEANVIREYSGSTGQDRIGIRATDDGTKIWNNLSYGFGTTNSRGIRTSTSTGVAYVFNNTVAGCDKGLTTSFEETDARNNIVYNCTESYSGTFNSASDYNSTDSAETTGGANDRQSQTFLFVDAGSFDFHLAATDTAARDVGVSLAADPALAFTVDIDGDTRPYNVIWDIGCDEYFVAAPGVNDTTTARGWLNQNRGYLARYNAPYLGRRR